MTCRLCLIAPPSRANQGPEFSAMQHLQAALQAGLVLGQVG